MPSDEGVTFYIVTDRALNVQYKASLVTCGTSRSVTAQEDLIVKTLKLICGIFFSTDVATNS